MDCFCRLGNHHACCNFLHFFILAVSLACKVSLNLKFLKFYRYLRKSQWLRNPSQYLFYEMYQPRWFACAWMCVYNKVMHYVTSWLSHTLDKIVLQNLTFNISKTAATQSSLDDRYSPVDVICNLPRFLRIFLSKPTIDLVLFAILISFIKKSIFSSSLYTGNFALWRIFSQAFKIVSAVIIT